MAGTGISGLSVAVITAGGVLIYAGIRGVTPLQALRDVSSGKPTPIPNVSPQVTGGNVAQSLQFSTVGRAALAAADRFMNDEYSQARRTQEGYSDCSSFVCKAFHAVGVAKPDGRMEWPNTSAFAIGPAWKTIPQAQASPGDIAVVPAGALAGHMTFVTNAGGTEGLGQQNPTSDVRAGSIAELFSGVTGKIVFRTYVGYGGRSLAGGRIAD